MLFGKYREWREEDNLFIKLLDDIVADNCCDDGLS